MAKARPLIVNGYEVVWSRVSRRWLIRGLLREGHGGGFRQGCATKPEAVELAENLPPKADGLLYLRSDGTLVRETILAKEPLIEDYSKPCPNQSSSNSPTS